MHLSLFLKLRGFTPSGHILIHFPHLIHSFLIISFFFIILILVISLVMIKSSMFFIIKPFIKPFIKMSYSSSIILINLSSTSFNEVLIFTLNTLFSFIASPDIVINLVVLTFPLNKLFDILDKKNVKANLFIEYKYLNSNITDIKNHNNHNIYLYQDNYTYDSLIISNNIIKRISDTNPIYCLTKEKNTNNLNICSYLEMYTIIPSINGNYNEIKTKLDNGSIILFDTSSVTISELSYIIDFITGKGYNIETLDKLLQEKI